MFTIYQQIANRLRTKLPALRTIDYDNGQLADPEKAYPLDFPAVLISNEDIDWKDEGGKIQRGRMVIAVTVAMRPTANSHQNAPTIHNWVTDMGIVNQVYTALKGYTGGETIVVAALVAATETTPEIPEIAFTGASFTSLTRTRTTRMKRWDNIQAFTHLFTCSFVDNTAQPVYIKPPTPISPVDLDLVVETPNKEVTTHFYLD